MVRLFLKMVEKLGYQKARRLAPQFGITPRDIALAAKHNEKQTLSMLRGKTQPSRAYGNPQRAVAQRIRHSDRGPMQAPAQGLREMEALANYRRQILPMMREQGRKAFTSTGDKNIDRIIKSVKRKRGQPASTFVGRKAARSLQEPLYYKRQARKLNKLRGRRESPEERLERLIDEFYGQ